MRLPGATHLVVMCRTESQAREGLRRMGLVMNRLGLKLHPTKTRMVDLRRGRESFVFLGCTIRKKRSILRNPRKYFMQRWPSPKATKRLRDRVRELTEARQSGKDVKADHRGTESRTSWLGQLLPNGECRSGVQQDGRLRLPDAATLAESAGRATVDGSKILDRQTAIRDGSVQAARHCALSVASSIRKIIGKLCAGKRHAQFERGLYGNGPAVASGNAGTAP